MGGDFSLLKVYKELLGYAEVNVHDYTIIFYAVVKVFPKYAYK